MAYITTILFFLVLIILVAYSYPARRLRFYQIYTAVPEEIAKSLRKFRTNHELQHIKINSTQWDYLIVGNGAETILFLHGMAGAYDIWWQIIEALKNHYRIISVTYPAVDNLAELSQGLVAILDKEKVSEVNVVGSSLGGYLAQYLVGRHCDRIKKAVYSNTFPPNDIMSRKYGRIGNILPFVPEWVLMLFFRQNTTRSLYPASGNSEIVAAYMREQSYGKMTKAQFNARFHCVLDNFEPPVSNASEIPILIIEADNDPLVEKQLREMLKTTYPCARVASLHKVGHFPYLNQPGKYIEILKPFLAESTSS